MVILIFGSLGFCIRSRKVSSVLNKGPPGGVIIFLGSCKRLAFSNILSFQLCQLHYDEELPINTENVTNCNLTKIHFKYVKRSASKKGLPGGVILFFGSCKV